MLAASFGGSCLEQPPRPSAASPTIEQARLLCIQAAALRTRYAAALFALLDARCPAHEPLAARTRHPSGPPGCGDPA